MEKALYFVIPCYNEEAVLYETARRIKQKLLDLMGKALVSDDSRIVFVNDGSKDRTWEIIRELHDGDRYISGVNLSRNQGHQNAVLAGLMAVKEYADYSISLDADLQDDINAIDEMVEQAINGTDIVYGVRKSRKKDSFFKKITAEGFYSLMRLLGVEVVFNHADYRLMTKRALEALAAFHEVNLFLRGIVPLVGFKSDVVYYERQKRFAGESKYPLKKMLSFAVEGITSFTVKPLRFISYLGLLFFVISLVAFVWIFIGKLRHYETSDGWASIMCSVWMIGGIQLFCIGIIGEYIGKIYSETKARPRYIIESFINTP
jgi:glycosyltransferase involved in cell wall biosynthesis